MDRTPIEHLLCARHHNHYDGSEVMEGPLYFFSGIFSFTVCHSLTHSLHSSRSASPCLTMYLTHASPLQFPLPLLNPHLTSVVAVQSLSHV